MDRNVIRMTVTLNKKPLFMNDTIYSIETDYGQQLLITTSDIRNLLVLLKQELEAKSDC